jgi:NAD+ kinase
MRRVVVFANQTKEGVLDAVQQAQAWLKGRAEVILELDLERPWSGPPADLVVVFGGDGTMLHAARKFAPSGMPVVGINVGKFGFLSEATVAESRQVLDDILGGRYQVGERMMLHCRLERSGQAVLDTPGLNDAVISRTSLSRLITIDLLVDGELVTTYRADGLIVATPVGSTAHSLAASGPLLLPELEAFVVSPICPHTLSNRPIVLPPDSVLEMVPRGGAENPALTVDGQVYRTLQEGDTVRVRRAEQKLRLIQTGRRTFFQTLRDKLGWSGEPRYVQ